MKILIISDVESKHLYEYFDSTKFNDIDLILSAGDLKPKYLSYIVTMLNVPLLYIHGNHDGRYSETPPEGCISIEDEIYNFKGLRIAGVGGCMEYTGGPHQFTEKSMRYRLMKSKLKFRKGFDILLTHSPAFKLGDGDDIAHIGFQCFVDLLDKHKPKYMIHGHQHLNYKRTQRIIEYNDTTIINAHDYYILEIDM